MNKFKKAIMNPKLAFLYILNYRIFRLLPDRLYLQIKYYLKMGKRLNIDKPKSFNEKLQWLKLNDRQPEYTNLVDKCKVREYISRVLGEEYLIPKLGIYDNFEEIDFNQLPNQFVLKPNHTSGDVFICKDKSRIDYGTLRKKVDKWLQREYFWVHREWPYKHIKPKIICEKYVVDESGVDLKDYKFMCFSGVPKLIQVMSGRRKGHYYLNHFDLKWNRIEIPRKSISENPNKLEKPENLEEMISICKELSKDIPFARIDLYNTQKQILFGEITFYPVSGFMDFKDEEHDYLLGSWIELPELNS